ncbi:MAG: ankyrin repeat domain-containing protein [Acidobacteria bacterium]|nr:ankyrin repeat domain-containing protein [Acidobacteriota bacterium]
MEVAASHHLSASVRERARGPALRAGFLLTAGLLLAGAAPPVGAVGRTAPVPPARAALLAAPVPSPGAGPLPAPVPPAATALPVRAAPAGAASDSPLADAAENRDRGAVRALAATEADPDAPQADGATALAWAAHWDDVDIADLLLRAGASPDAANDLGVTPLMLASANGSTAMAERLLAAGADPNAGRPAGETALMMGARAGAASVVRLLIAAGADVDPATHGGHTALMFAAAERHPRVVTLLAEVGADVGARTRVRTRQGRPIVREAIVLSPSEAVNPAVLPRDGDRDPPRPEGGFTPLLHAVLAGDPEVVGVLLAAGANVDDAGPDGVTALMLALTKHRTSVARLLIERGADPRPAEAGYTALHLAAATGQLAIAEMLLARGADPDARLERPQRLTNAFEIGVFTSPGSGRLTQIGSTPFLVAAKSVDAAMMRLLAAAGADTGATTDDGTNALMLAAGLGKRAATDITYYDWTEAKAVEALTAGLELGLDIDAANDHGETALHAAAYHNANRAIRFLVDRGADLDAQNAARQTPLRIAEGHLICCTTFVRHAEAAAELLALGADSDAGIQLTFGLTSYGDEAGAAAPSTGRP